MSRAEQLALGLADRQEGMEAVSAAAVAVHRPYREHFEAALSELIREGKPFTADDVRRRVRPDVAPHHPNVIGALMAGAATKGLIREIAWRRSTTRSRHAGRVAVWLSATAVVDAA